MISYDLPDFASRLFSGAAQLTANAGHVPISFFDVLTTLMEGTMDGEPDRIMAMQGESLVSRFAWCMMALFGVVVVLLLLNLLIARFAKTFDLVHEDLAGTFQVAFARVAIKGAGLQAIPPPFNLVRGLVLALYAAADTLGDLARLGLRAWCNHAAFESLRDETSISQDQTASIVAFLKKATSPGVHLYPHVVEAWVKLHQHDYSRDERWRTNMNKKLGAVEDEVRGLGQKVGAMHTALEQMLQNQERILASQHAAATAGPRAQPPHC